MDNRLFMDKAFTKRTQETLCATLELKPVGNTLSTIMAKNYVDNDMSRLQGAKSMKKYVDMYAVEFYCDNLEGVSFDYKEAYELKINGEHKAYDALVDKMSKTISDSLKKASKSKDCGMAFDSTFYFEVMPDYLKKKGFAEEAIRLANMKGALPLFDDITTNVKTSVVTGVPKRFVENLERYFSNIPVFKRLLDEGTELDAELWDYVRMYASPEGYSECISPDGIAVYNKVVAGQSDEAGVVVKGYNSYANEQNNRIRSENSTEKRYVKAKRLYKAVLVPMEKAFEIGSLSSNEDAIDAIKTDVESVKSICERASLLSYNEEEMYVSGNSLASLSYLIFRDINVIGAKVKEISINEINEQKLTPAKKKKAIDKVQKDIDGNVYNLGYLSQIMNEDLLEKIEEIVADCLLMVENAVSEIEESDIYECKKLNVDALHKAHLKNLFDAVKELRRVLRIVSAAPEDESESATTSDILEVVEGMALHMKLSNLIHAYMVKSFKDNVVKIPICFNTPSKFVASWFNKEHNGKFEKSDHTIIKHDNKLYLFTLTDDCKPVAFDEEVGNEEYVEVYSVQKMRNPIMILPMKAFPDEVKHFFADDSNYVYVLKNGKTQPVVVTRETFEIYNKGLYKTEYKKSLLDELLKKKESMSEQEYENAEKAIEDEYSANLLKILIYYKDILDYSTDMQGYDFSYLPDLKTYKNSSEFFNDVAKKNVNMKWLKVKKSQVDKLVEDGKALMFLITNNYMYRDDKQKTDYAAVMLSIFSDENMADTNIVLNAAPSIFFRPRLFEPKIAHKKGSVLVNRLDNDGNKLTESVYQQLYHYFNGRLKLEQLSKEAYEMKDNVGHKEAGYDMYFKKSYSEDKFLLTFSYVLNKQAGSSPTFETDLNKDINDIVSSGDVNILSIVRGTKHLLYYVLMDKEGHVLKEGDLDVINGTDYLKELQFLSKQRNIDKKELWKYDTKASTVKDYYIKCAVGEIAKMALENNAIIVMEKLDNIRDKWNVIDNQIFGKFEDALVRKLAHVRNKKLGYGEVGGVLNPYQLSFDGPSWQRGIVNLQPASYTSTVDFSTGFVNNFNFKELNSISKKREFLARFDKIYKIGDSFFFQFNYNNFTDKIFAGKAEWTVKVSGERTLLDQNIKAYVYHKDVASEIQTMLLNDDIVIAENENIDISGLSNSTVVAIVDILREVVYGRVRACDKVAEEYKVSPITGERYENSYRNSAVLLAKKYILFRNDSFDEEAKEYSAEMYATDKRFSKDEYERTYKVNKWLASICE